MPPPSSAPVKPPQTQPQNNNLPVKKPLASMLPEKYKSVDVQSLFPEFRENQVLRFSRLFPIKSSYKPRIWKNVKRRFKTENAETASEQPPTKMYKVHSALCSRNFQNVKLSQHSVEFNHLPAIQILGEIKFW